MRFLAEECTGPTIARWLSEQGHEVFSVYDESPGETDARLIQKAYAEKWLRLTNDKDFGEKVYRERHPHHGVILLRLEDERSASKVAVIERLLTGYSAQLADPFVVVTETQVRFARS